MKQQQDSINLCLVCNRSYELSQTHCLHDGAPLIKRGEVSIAPLDSLYEIETVWNSRICHTIQLKAKESDERVIAKVYIPRTNDLREKERFKRIESTLSVLHHSSIPRVLQSGKLKDRRPYVLLEYKPGIALRELLRGGKKLDPQNVCRIAIKVCEILEYAHRKNVIHPDLSPGDIIVEPLKSVKDCLWNVSLVDFGKGSPLIHADNRKAQFTELGDFFGTPEFIAPEMIAMKEIDARANVYSLACIMYFALKGEHAFKGPNWFATMSMHATAEPAPIFSKPTKFQERIEKIVLKSLNKNPDQRPQSVAELKSELQSLAKLTLEGSESRRKPI